VPELKARGAEHIAAAAAGAATPAVPELTTRGAERIAAAAAHALVLCFCSSSPGPDSELVLESSHFTISVVAGPWGSTSAAAAAAAAAAVFTTGS
jgi:hypothetical protein